MSLSFLSLVHGAVCERAAGSAWAVSPSGSGASQCTQRDAGQSAGPREGQYLYTRITPCVYRVQCDSVCFYVCLRVEEQLPAWRDKCSTGPRGAKTGQAERAWGTAVFQRDAGSGHWTQPALAGSTALNGLWRSVKKQSLSMFAGTFLLQEPFQENF